MLPFLKNKEAAVVDTEDEAITRKPDESFEMLDAIAEDMLTSFQKKDKGMLKAALEALMEHIQDADLKQDQITNEGNM